MGGGGGVDGAIHRVAGPELLTELEKLGDCPAGEARLTGAYNLHAKHIIHAVGPLYQGGDHGEADVLASAYKWALRLAEENGVETLAFPSIATGAYEYPHEEACEVAVKTVEQWVSEHDLPKVVTFCCHAPEDVSAYQTRLKREATPL